MFNGNCEEAMRFYAGVLDGKVTAMVRINDTPMAAQMPPGTPNFVVNSRIELPGGAWLYGGDSAPHITHSGISGISIALNYPTAGEAEAAFQTLSEGGNVEMPFGETFWAKGFGMCQDRFGVDWIINGELTD